MSDDGVAKLDALLVDFRDIWRLRLGNDPPADVPPMETQMKPDARALIAKVRRYAPTHRAFMSAQVAKTEEQGIIYCNQSSAWASAPHIVSKPKARSFRFTLECKRANEAQIPSKWPMPHLESELAKVVGSTCFATFDFSNGYCQLPLHPDPQEVQSFICPDGIFSPTRVMQGNANATGHFQSVFDNPVQTSESCAGCEQDQLHRTRLIW
jgi:hypothetical protein